MPATPPPVADSPPPAGAPGPRRRFAPAPILLLPIVMALLGTLPLAGSSPWLAPLVALPLACAVWVLRARVVVAPVGVEVCNGLRRHRVAWADVEGFDLPEQGVPRLLFAGRRRPLTAVRRGEVRDLVAAATAAGTAGIKRISGA